MKNQIINRIIYSRFDERVGPLAVASIPSDLSEEIGRIVSDKSINILVGEHGIIPESLSVYPFPSLNLKGVIKNLAIPNALARGKSIDGAITVLFTEENDPIFYKYLKHFEEEFSKVANRIVELEKSKADDQQIEEELKIFNNKLTGLLNELRDAEFSSSEAEAFPKAEETSEEIVTYRFKVIVCGDPAVGKTSTVLRFTDNAFRRSYLPTIGTNISEKNIQINGNIVQFVIWDVAGQSKFQMMRKHFYKGAEGQLLIFDLTRPQTFKSITHWFQDIKLYTETGLYGFILGNKSDLVDMRKINKDEISKLAKELNLGFIETSALTGENVDNAFHKLARLLIEHKNR